MGSDASDQTPRVFADMGRLAGVSPTTLSNWTRAEPPLETTGTGRQRMVSWRQLAEFCSAHPELPAARKVLERQGPPHVAPSPDDRYELDVARSLARAARTAAAANLDALVAAARHAEETARFHREQLERLRKSLEAYEDAVGQFTVPTTLND